jgi:hypothetical protein
MVTSQGERGGEGRGPKKEGVLSVRANEKRQLRSGVIQRDARSGFPPKEQFLKKKLKKFSPHH